MPRFLKSRGLIPRDAQLRLDTAPVNADKLYKGEQRPKPAIADQDWLALSQTAKEELGWYCERFGYPLPGALASIAPAAEPQPAPRTEGLEKRFLTPSGWTMSQSQERPVRVDGRPLPWFTYGAIEFLDRVVDGGMRVFEYGAGFSTLWWQRAARVHSVDHDPAWINEIRPQLGANVSLSLIEQNAPPPPGADAVLARFQARPRRRTWDYPAERVVRRGLEDDSFAAYAAHVCNSGLDYDVIIIDGMAGGCAPNSRWSAWRRMVSSFSTIPTEATMTPPMTSLPRPASSKFRSGGSCPGQIS